MIRGTPKTHIISRRRGFYNDYHSVCTDNEKSESLIFPFKFDKVYDPFNHSNQILQSST